MALKYFVLGTLTACALAACGGSKSPVAAPRAGTEESEASTDTASKAEAAEDKESGSSASTEVPKDCYKPSGTCLPSPKFVRKLCNNRFPSMALYLFSNPKWVRGYLTRRTEAWNASGGASAGGYVEFDEEVLLLAERKAAEGGMQVSGAGGGYDALRWDGSCVTLSTEEVTLSRPPSPKTPHIEWRFLDDNVQEALRKDDKINALYLERRKECKGAVSGDVSAKCVKVDTGLGDAIVAMIRGGASVPQPTTLP